MPIARELSKLLSHVISDETKAEQGRSLGQVQTTGQRQSWD